MNRFDAASLGAINPMSEPLGNSLSHSRLALDANNLEALKRDAKADSPEARKQAALAAAKQFEAVFMNMLMKSMRDALPHEDPLESDASRSYQGMLDQQLVQSMSSGKGLGLADIIARQLTGESGHVLPDSLRGLPKLNESRLDSTAPLDSQSKLSSNASSAIHAYQKNKQSDPKVQAFISQHWDAAKTAERATGIPAQFILGQAALETGWGKREIKGTQGENSFNLFGIKADSSWQGRVTSTQTTEFVQGEKIKATEKFRAYRSYAEAFTDYANMLKNNPRYRQAFNASHSVEQFAANLQKAGYATDPEYANKLVKTINRTLRVSV